MNLQIRKETSRETHKSVLQIGFAFVPPVLVTASQRRDLSRLDKHGGFVCASMLQAPQCGDNLREAPTGPSSGEGEARPSTRPSGPSGEHTGSREPSERAQRAKEIFFAKGPPPSEGWGPVRLGQNPRSTGSFRVGAGSPKPSMSRATLYSRAFRVWEMICSPCARAICCWASMVAASIPFSTRKRILTIGISNFVHGRRFVSFIRNRVAVSIADQSCQPASGSISGVAARMIPWESRPRQSSRLTLTNCPRCLRTTRATPPVDGRSTRVIAISSSICAQLWKPSARWYFDSCERIFCCSSFSMFSDSKPSKIADAASSSRISAWILSFVISDSFLCLGVSCETPGFFRTRPAPRWARKSQEDQPRGRVKIPKVAFGTAPFAVANVTEWLS